MPRVKTALVLLVTALVLSSAANSEHPSPPSSSRIDTVATTDHYVFLSHPWLSLHHFVYQWAKADQGDFQRYSVVERDSLNQLSPSERETWMQAVSVYADRIVDRDLHRNDTMRHLRNQLRDTPSLDPDSLGALPFDLHSVLRPAMTVYRTHWWNTHEAQVHDWIQTVAPRLDSMEDTLVARLEYAYDGSFPERRARVFVMPYSNWSGAYATIRPLQISVAVQRLDPATHVTMEMLLHETAHSAAFSNPLRSALREAFSEYSAEPPSRFWHTVIFYTSGEITRRHLASNSYRHYGERYDLYDKEDWKPWIRELNQHWRPFLNGTVERDSAYRRIARTLASLPEW